MTGPEHYREAERHLSAASFKRGLRGRPSDPAATAHHLAMAQVHATLALAAATALPTGGPDAGSRGPWIRAIHGMEQHGTSEENAS